jgi:hypothetical protein
MSHAATEPNCLNCGAELRGEYCHACGQKAASMQVGMHDFVHDATHEFLHLDGKILQTVKLLVTKPGALTREFLAGRRVRYITPVRLYLTMSLLFFTLVAILPGHPQPIVKIGGMKQPTAKTASQRRLLTGLQKAQKDLPHVSEKILHHVPKVMFVLMPIFALLTWAFYREQQRFYIPHLYYAVHFHAFVFLVMSVYVLLTRLVLQRPVAATLILVNVPYHFIALRRVFGGSRGITFAKGFAIGFLYWLIAVMTMMVVALAVILTL